LSREYLPEYIEIYGPPFISKILKEMDFSGNTVTEAINLYPNDFEAALTYCYYQ